MFKELTTPTIEEFHTFLKGMRLAEAENIDETWSLGRVVQRYTGKDRGELFILATDSVKAGALCECLTDGLGSRYLFIWAAYAFRGVPFDVKAAYDALVKEAKKHACSYIEFGSARVGWARKLRELNVQVQPVVTYRKYL